ncbi:MAG: GntG family PLP-dependent aldolase [Balneolaceae bacterium]|nr:GntG family PLP-dependent aldolase [Balneolaceae bacterium]
MPIDLRSDTVTKPTEGMLRAMTSAEVGDDLFGEDPTINALERNVAALFGFEAGLFVPSGTMGNQLSLKVLTEPGDEVLIEKNGHIIHYEAAAASFISSVHLNTVAGERGKLAPGLLKDLPRGQYLWEPHTRVIALENSTNKGGGACYTRQELQDLRDFADKHDLFIHLDGARIWNAITATGIDPRFFGSIADTLSVCFSKGLGAPVGSMLLSSESRVQDARRYRKMLGGGMRQAGVLAAAADYAIEHHWKLLKFDHWRAKKLARAITECKKLSVDPETVETNIVIFDLKKQKATTALKKLKEEHVLMVPFGPKTLRATFHHHISDEGLEYTISILQKLFG